MAYRNRDSPPNESRPSSTAAPSSDTPSSSHVTSLPSLPMVAAPDDTKPSPRSTRATPDNRPIDLPRAQSASKGGCWTCRLRRKKCDEQREGDSCRTCIRLTIDCLGWGPKRPDWMRDKQAVEAYKAKIKAQLTRAGLIRGQPRSSLIHTADSAPMPPTRPHPYRSASASDVNSSSLHYNHHPDYGYRYMDTTQDQHQRQPQTLIPGMPGASNSTFHQLSESLYANDSGINALDLHGGFMQYPTQPVTPLSTSSSLGTESLSLEFPPLASASEQTTYEYDLRPPSPGPPPFISGQNNVQSDHVIYYFEHVRKIQYLFAGNAFTNATYSSIVQNPRGAVTNAVCALASLHFSRMRVAQGLEAPDPNPEHSNAIYFNDEAYFQIETNKQLQGRYSESDALAALHLISFSQMSGCATSWQPAFSIVCEWLDQTGLVTDDNATVTFLSMSQLSQLIVKAALWLDIFSALTLTRAPKYLILLKQLLGESGGYWPNPESMQSLRMDLLTGCPDEALLAFGETLALACWKANEQGNGSLSFRELIRRGDVIEQRLRARYSEPASKFLVDTAPLHPGLVQTSSATESGVVPFPNDDMRRQVCDVFRESAMLYLHTILSNANPGVPEISASVDAIIQLLGRLPSSDIDRALTYPICLAGSMANDLARRDFFKARLRVFDDSVGNLAQTRLAMDTLWQKRDVGGGPVELQDIVQELGLNLMIPGSDDISTYLHGSLIKYLTHVLYSAYFGSAQSNERRG